MSKYKVTEWSILPEEKKLIIVLLIVARVHEYDIEIFFLSVNNNNKSEGEKKQ